MEHIFAKSTIRAQTSLFSSFHRHTLFCSECFRAEWCAFGISLLSQQRLRPAITPSSKICSCLVINGESWFFNCSWLLCNGDFIGDCGSLFSFYVHWLIIRLLSYSLWLVQWHSTFLLLNLIEMYFLFIFIRAWSKSRRLMILSVILKDGGASLGGSNNSFLFVLIDHLLLG